MRLGIKKGSGTVPMLYCKTCDGKKEIQVEYGVEDYVNGGYLALRWVECEDCNGSGVAEAQQETETNSYFN